MGDRQALTIQSHYQVDSQQVGMQVPSFVMQSSAEAYFPLKTTQVGDALISSYRSTQMNNKQVVIIIRHCHREASRGTSFNH